MTLKSIAPFVQILFVMGVSGFLHTPRQLDGTEVAEKCDLTARPQCSSDCTKILTCVSRIETPILTINCTASRPFCKYGRCIATPGVCASKTRIASAPFLCTSPGVFPDPIDCSKSHKCPDVGSEGITSVCSRGRIFNSRLKKCVRKTTQHEEICKEMSCDGVINDFITFPSNQAFYSYCFTSATGVQQMYMYKCDDEINKVFDLTNKKCRFNCKSIGYFADPLDCNAYYICNGLKFASRYVHCPPNYYFNGSACVNSKAHCPEGSIVNVNVTTLIPSTDNPVLVADEVVSILSSSTTELTTAAITTTTEETTTLSTTTEEITTVETTTASATEFTTIGVYHDDVTTTQKIVDGPQMTTKKPSIWKHMGLISVRIGRFFNFI